MTQKELADKVGVSKMHLCKLLRDINQPSVELTIRISKEVGYPIEKIREIQS